ncbi:hypothetical protein [Alteromonas sp. ASW11-130]|uniref:hypothetical protein n=1 Tax=Alteromonas sp. ASW11-130 TaxID=3015775 RepID=UPI002241950D|nr:hypothetical protein [Alteromonas sp. ASW11-130]MCW8091415.1 hypothetical protein [Alteromonas sp. ASW11-130]
MSTKVNSRARFLNNVLNHNKTLGNLQRFSSSYRLVVQRYISIAIRVWWTQGAISAHNFIFAREGEVHHVFYAYARD